MIRLPPSVTGMTTAELAPAAHPDVATRPRLLTAALARLLLADFCAMASFYLLLSTVPLYATEVGAGELGAGVTTAVLMLSAVAAELTTPRLAAKLGHHRALILGLVLLGAPALLMPLWASTLGLLVISAVRGLGFAVVVVTVGALTPNLVPAARRGEGLGVLGVAATIPAVGALPAGLWLVETTSFSSVFAVAALLAGVGAVAVVGLSSGDGHDGEPLRIGKAVTAPALRRPALAFAATAMAAGALVTFLPAALQADTGLAAGALLLQALTAAAARWFTGRHSDRHQQPGRALALGLAVTAAGLATLAAAGTQPAIVLAGAAVFGAGFGVAQSASLTLMLNRVAPSGYATISAVWNMGYDLGWAVGAAGFGLLTTTTGYPAAFALTAAVTALALPLTRPARPAQSGGRTR